MDDAIERQLSEHGGACSRRSLLSVLTRNQLDNEIRRGRLVPVFPRVYARPWSVDEPAVREVAAIASVGAPAVLSHTSALRRWGLELPRASSTARLVHVTTSARRHPRGADGLVVHRGRRPELPLTRDGLPTQRLEDALLTSWHLSAPPVRRAPVILAVAQRLTTPQRLAAALDGAPRGARELVELLHAGCRSELEIWGYLNVFDVPGLRDAVRQRPVRVGKRTYYLDVAYDAERVAVELDGRAYHSSPTQWERDIARDLVLATVGWQTIRLSHLRLTTDVEGCRRDVVAVRRARRRRAQPA